MSWSYWVVSRSSSSGASSACVRLRASSRSAAICCFRSMECVPPRLGREPLVHRDGRRLRRPGPLAETEQAYPTRLASTPESPAVDHVLPPYRCAGVVSLLQHG